VLAIVAGPPFITLAATWGRWENLGVLKVANHDAAILRCNETGRCASASRNCRLAQEVGTRSRVISSCPAPQCVCSMHLRAIFVSFQGGSLGTRNMPSGSIHNSYQAAGIPHPWRPRGKHRSPTPHLRFEGRGFDEWTWQAWHAQSPVGCR